MRARGFRHGRYKNGLRAGWAEYRYGLSKPKRIQHKRILNADARNNVIVGLTEILDRFHLTKFEHEATCRNGLRSRFCLQGYGWARSDNEAAILVAEALKKLGAKRPTWEEGQKYHVDGTGYCNWCQQPLEVGSGRFCSRECAKALIAKQEGRDEKAMGTALNAAWRVIDRTNQKPKTCETCGKQFYAHRASAGRFCSQACSQEAFSMGGPRQCLICEAMFKPIHRYQKCCSRACGATYNTQIKAERMSTVRRRCPECGEDFAPKLSHMRFCSRDCGIRNNQRRQRAKRKAAENPDIIRLPEPEDVPMTKEMFDSWFETA